MLKMEKPCQSSETETHLAGFIKKKDGCQYKSKTIYKSKRQIATIQTPSRLIEYKVIYV